MLEKLSCENHSISNNESEIYIAGGKIDRKYPPFMLIKEVQRYNTEVMKLKRTEKYIIYLVKMGKVDQVAFSK